MKEIQNDTLRGVLANAFGWNISSQNLLESTNASVDDDKARSIVDKDLSIRAGRRLVAKVVNAQKNMEDVAERADEILQSEPEAPTGQGETDQGWIDDCLEGAGKAYNDDLKNYWAKLLAGEIRNPGYYSLRAVDFMKKLSKNDAERIRAMCRYVLYSTDGRDAFILRYTDSPYTYSDLSFLMELRLIDSSNFVVKQYRFPNETGGSAGFVHGNAGLALTIAKKEYDLPIYSFTQLGNEMLTIIDDVEIDFDYLRRFAKESTGKNKFLKMSGGHLLRIGNAYHILNDGYNFDYPEVKKEEGEG